jgi:uncharacterized protein (TIGR03083 family)
MVQTAIDRSTVEEALARQGEQFEQLIRSLPAEAGSRPVPTCEGWSVADVAAHVLTLWRRAISDFRRSETAEATAALNATCLDETPERDLATLADLLATDGAAARSLLASLPDSLEFAFHAGTTTTVVPASCVVIAELVVHGFDVATATGSPWQPDENAAAVALDGFDDLLRAGWLAPIDAPLLDRVREERPATTALMLELTGRLPPSSDATAALVAALRPF